MNNNTRYIERPEYISRIEPLINKPIIKVLIGQRRVGKSFLLYQIIDIIKHKNKNAKIIYINKELFEFDKIRDYKSLIDYVEQKKQNKDNYLLIDEIQDIDGFEKALRHFALDENMDLYCTGSNAKLLSGELATYLSGRCIEIKVYSLSFQEFLVFHQLKKSNESLKKYIYWGGLPFLKNLEKNDDLIFEYLRNINSTIIYKDIISRFQIRNTYFLENLIHFLANNTGNIISAKKISDYLKSQDIKMSPQIVLNYLDYLKQALLIYNAKRINLIGKKVFEINEKFYFEDWGLMNSLVGKSKIDIGKIIENIVYIHLKIKGYEVFIGKLKEKEIDFVGIKDGNKIYIQVCYLLNTEKIKEREFGNLMEIKDNYPKYVVSMDEFAPENINGIKHFHLLDFLTEEKFL